MTPQVTALIPTYQRPRLLKRAIKAVLNQKHADVKVKIFDDASGDETEEMVTKMQLNDKRIEYYCHKKNIGFLENFKYAFTKIDTPYFSVQGDDDFLLDTFYKDALKVLETNKEIDFVIMGTLLIDENMNLVEDLDNSNNLSIHGDENRFDDWISGKIPRHWEAILFRKEVAATYLDMDPKNLDVGHDIRFLIRAISRHKFACLTKPGACYLFWDGNITIEVIKPIDYFHHAIQMSRLIEIYADKNVSTKTKKKIPAIIEGYFHQNLLIDSLKMTIFKILRSHIFNLDKDKIPIKNSIDFYYLRGYKKSALLLKILLNSKLVNIPIHYLIGPFAKKILEMKKNKLADLKEKKFSKEFQNIHAIMLDFDD